MINQKVLPVISDWKTYELFLKSEISWCILMDFHINFIEELVKQAHNLQKKVIVHMDLIHGIANDPYGAQFMCQKYHVDGIISTKAKVIEAAKANHCIAILRLFLIDTRSLEKGCGLANHLYPDYLEILPAMTVDAVKRVRAYSNLPIIGGGLIASEEDINTCLHNDMVAVSSSNFALCLSYLTNKEDIQ